MDASQLEYDFPEGDSNQARPGRVVTTTYTDLGPFGNRVDVIVVEGTTVGGASHLECTDPDVKYFNMHS